MYIIGLTGGIGSGKSSVADWLREHGVAVVDADAVVHRLLSEDRRLIAGLAGEFGTGILDANSAIDRRALAKIVFASSGARRRLEAWVHPRVLAAMRTASEQIEATGQQICVWDVPLLFEAGFAGRVDEVWVVWVPEEVQIQRVQQRDKLSVAEVQARIAAQMPLEKKKSLADVLIDNSGTWADTEIQLNKAWQRIQRYVSGQTVHTVPQA